ncbi:MAG: CPBP family intramembrane metalloprotease [Dehalococcoidia bacterium]|nr:CPBP family intramembrane metalloprotease [Dehalococcoidia bacterium]
MFADPPLEAAGPAPPCGEWRSSDLLLGAALLAASIVGLTALLAVYAADLDGGGVTAAATLAFEVGLGGIVALLAWRRGLRPRDLGFVRPRRWRPLGLAWAGVYVALVAYQLVLALIAQLGVDTSGLSEGNALPLGDDVGAVKLSLLALSVVVGAPLGEELFFRALLYRGLRRLWGVLPGIAASAVLFAGFHLDLSVLVPFVLVGALLAWSYEASGSLWVPITVHALFNGASFALQLALDGAG